MYIYYYDIFLAKYLGIIIFLNELHYTMYDPGCDLKQINYFLSKLVKLKVFNTLT